MSLGVKVHFAMLSKEGGRPRNEDYVRADEKSGEYLFALADGLGDMEKEMRHPGWQRKKLV